MPFVLLVLHLCPLVDILWLDSLARLCIHVGLGRPCQERQNILGDDILYLERKVLLNKVVRLLDDSKVVISGVPDSLKLVFEVRKFGIK